MEPSYPLPIFFHRKQLAHYVKSDCGMYSKCICRFSGFLLLLFVLLDSSLHAQNCAPTVPSFTVNLSGSPSASWISPTVTRVDLCCGVSSPNTCVEFILTLDTGSQGINFNIYSGAVPGGSMFYQVNCGPPVAVGAPLCLSGPGPFEITFCKPGHNSNQYIITSIAKPGVSANISLDNGCTGRIGAVGFTKSTLVWNSIFPGAFGAFNSYMNCTSGCDTVQVTAQVGYPPFVDFQVCGTPSGGCIASTVCDTVRVYFNPTLFSNITPVNPTVCFGSAGTTITAHGTGGSPPYTYSWSNGANTQSVFVGPGTYSVSVKDSTNCPPTSSTVVVTSFSSAIAANAGAGQSVCAANANVTLSGSVTAASGGMWSGGAGTYNPNAATLNAVYTPSSSEITSGSVVLTLTTTGNGTCPPASNTTTITINSFQAALSTSTQGTSCLGTADGSATVTAVGGASPFIYSWNTTPSQSTAMASGLPAGIYTVYLTDANGCGSTSTATINQPSLLSASISGQTNASCNGSSNGTAIVSGGGGTIPYTYSWNTNPSQTGSSAGGLAAGTYSATVTDAHGCHANASVTITQPVILSSAVSSATNVSCSGGNNGTASASGSGGTAPYTYSWSSSPVQTSAAAASLAAGTYTVTVNDANGCLTSSAITVAQPAVLSASITGQTGASCMGGNNGTATAAGAGGTAPYTYSWSTLPAQTGTNATGLLAGTYTASLTDAHGCPASVSVTITQPLLLSSSIASSTNVGCFGGNNGTASASGSGGTAPYTYSWSCNPVQTTSTASNLTTGTYTVAVNDANGCLTSSAITIIQPAVLSASINGQTGTSCNGGNNGTATAAGSGGTLPYTYSWNTAPAQTGINATGLLAGTYTASVTDAHGCPASASVTITQPLLLSSAIASSTNVGCFGGNNGSASASGSGGTAPYTYSWSSNPVQTTSTASNLIAGTYSVTVKDAKGCSASSTILISQPALLTASINAQTNASCNGAANGTATVTGGGGTTPYTYSWNTAPVQTGSNAGGLTAGTYSVVITDAHGCPANAFVTITQPVILTSAISSSTNVSCFGGKNGTASASGSGGTSPFTYSWNSSPVQTAATANNLPAGTYTATVEDAHGCKTFSTALITQPALLILNSTGLTTTCNGICNGQAIVIPQGGTIPYTYSWTGSSSTTASASQLCPGLYTVLVTDQNGCKHSTVDTVRQPAALALSAGSLAAHCMHPDGTVSVSTTGGTPGYTYLWKPGFSTSANQSGLLPGTYTVIVKDAHGCQDSAKATVSNTLGATVSIVSVTPVSCAASCNGTATASATGGTAPYLFTWLTNPAQAGSSANSLCLGSCKVIVNDAHACIDTATAIVSGPTQVVVNPATVSTLCIGQSVLLSASSSGGAGPYSYSWNPAGPLVNPSTSTNYTVTATDVNGCNSAPAQDLIVWVGRHLFLLQPLVVMAAPIITPGALEV